MKKYEMELEHIIAKGKKHEGFDMLNTFHDDVIVVEIDADAAQLVTYRADVVHVEEVYDEYDIMDSSKFVVFSATGLTEIKRESF